MAIRLVLRSSGTRSVPDGMSYEFDQSRVVIGRAVGSDVCIPHPSISDTHAVIEPAGSRVLITDHGSLNGTRINGTPLAEGRSKALSHGDVIQLADFVLRFETGLVIGQATTAERTASLARRLICEMLPEHVARASVPRLVVLNGAQVGHRVRVPEPPVRLCVGRGEQCQFRLDHPDVSREHFELVRDADGVLARDLDSKNGLQLSGRKIRQRRLKDGDELQLGELRLLFEDPAEEAVRLAASEPLQALEMPPDPVRPETLEPLRGDLAATQEADSESTTSSGTAKAMVQRSAKGARSGLGSAEVVIYAFAVVIVTASAAALFALLSS